MTPALPAAGLLACLAVGAYGVVLVRDRGAAARFGAELPTGRRREGFLGAALGRLADVLAPRVTRHLGEERLAQVRTRLDAAGRPGGMTIESYAGRKGVHLVLYGSTGVLMALGGRPVIGALIALGGWFQLDYYLWRTTRRRRDRIDRDLPDFLDILAVTVGAGVAFRSALGRVADAVGGPIGEEATIALRQMDLGATRRDAFTALRRRTRSEYLGQFVTALLQAEELGVPLADALVGLSRDMRQSFHQEARRRAARAAPRVSLIVSLVVVPGSILLILGGLLIGGVTGQEGVFGD